jgi:hypothetical protein
VRTARRRWRLAIGNSAAVIFSEASAMNPTYNSGASTGSESTSAYEPGVAADRLGANGAEAPPGEAFKRAAGNFAELKDYLGYFVAAKLDGIKLSFRNLGLYAVLGVLALIAGGAIIVTAAVLLLTGLAGAIGAIFDPDKPWVGQIVVGLLVLGGLAGGTIMFLKKFTKASRERTVKKYESRQRQQRVDYGHDVAERGRQPAARAGE